MATSAWKTNVDTWLKNNPNATSADTYNAAVANGGNYDTSTKTFSFGGETYQPTKNTGMLGSGYTTGAPMIDAGAVESVYGKIGGLNTGYNAAQISTAGLPGFTNTTLDPNSVANVNAQNAKAYTAPATAQTYNANQMKMNDGMLVQNRLNSILNENSALMQSAKGSAMQVMNERGLLNSSLAIGAGQKAMIDSAMPIASQDASTTYNVGKSNMDAENRAREFAANAQNTRDIENAKLQTETELQNVRNQLDAAVANQNTSRIIQLQNVANGLEAQKAVFSAEVDARTNNAQFANAANQAKYKGDLDIALGAAGSQIDAMRGNQSAQSGWNLNELQNSQAFKMLNSQQKAAATQAYATAGNAITQQYNAQIQQIQMDNNLTTEQKQAAIDQLQNNQYPSAISMLNASFTGLSDMVGGIDMIDIA